MDKRDRWRLIAEAVGGRSKKECVERFKVLRARIQSRQREGGDGDDGEDGDGGNGGEEGKKEVEVVEGEWIKEARRRALAAGVGREREEDEGKMTAGDEWGSGVGEEVGGVEENASADGVDYSDGSSDESGDGTDEEEDYEEDYEEQDQLVSMFAPVLPHAGTTASNAFVADLELEGLALGKVMLLQCSELRCNVGCSRCGTRVDVEVTLNKPHRAWCDKCGSQHGL